MTTPAERYKQKLDLRDTEQRPNMRVARQIEESRVAKVDVERRQKGEELRRAATIGSVNPQQVRWEDAAEDGADMSEGVQYSYMTDDNPHRYLYGVDMATGGAASMTSDLDIIEAADETDFTDEMLNTMAQVPNGIFAGFRNIGRTIRDTASGLGAADSFPLDDEQTEVARRFGIDSQNSTVEQRRAVRRYTSEQRMSSNPFPEPTNTVSEFVKPISQFIFFAGPVTKMIQAAGATALAADVAGGAAVSTVIWDRGEPELANLLVQLDQPELTRNVLEYLAVDPENDSEVELRTKRALNDVLMNFAARGLGKAFIQSIKGLRGVAGKMMHTEVEGYLELAAMRQRGEVMMYGAAPGTEEITAWIKIIAGKIGKGFDQATFRLQGARHYDEKTLNKIWEGAEALRKGD